MHLGPADDLHWVLLPLPQGQVHREVKGQIYVAISQSILKLAQKCKNWRVARNFVAIDQIF